MAKKKKTTTTTNTTSTFDIVKFCAFWGLAVAALASCISFVISLLAKCGVTWNLAGRVVGICNTIAQIAFLVAIFIPAYRYVRGKSTVYKAFFWVAVILVILGFVGINLIF